ncbi:hypothetical protein [Kingella oralis]|uniref:hypothetical protein n=1 Tax=Kingella oralis TaxID=505 RepID=UPI002D7E32F4|nr:hypothetical protein [Kingella oralis]
MPTTFAKTAFSHFQAASPFPKGSLKYFVGYAKKKTHHAQSNQQNGNGFIFCQAVARNHEKWDVLMISGRVN